MNQILPYQPKHNIRIVTAASLFDGHDAAINIMRRIIQSTGVEVIHLGHDRSVEEVVNTAIQEDANAIAMTSYQGGHNEYFKYMFDLLKERGSEHIKIFGGGGGTFLPDEIKKGMLARVATPPAINIHPCVSKFSENPNELCSSLSLHKIAPTIKATTEPSKIHAVVLFLFCCNV